jgi:hypothetical protein
MKMIWAPSVFSMKSAPQLVDHRRAGRTGAENHQPSHHAHSLQESARPGAAGRGPRIFAGKLNRLGQPSAQSNSSAN